MAQNHSSIRPVQLMTVYLNYYDLLRSPEGHRSAWALLFSLNSPNLPLTAQHPPACHPVSPHHTIQAGGDSWEYEREPGSPQVGCGQPSRGTPRKEGPSETADVAVPNLDVVR